MLSVEDKGNVSFQVRDLSKKVCKTNEPGHRCSYKIFICAQRRLRSDCAYAQSDQSLRRTLCVATDPKCHSAESEDSDQTAWMRRLIWVFAGRTWSLVGNAVSRLKWYLTGKKSAQNFANSKANGYTFRGDNSDKIVLPPFLTSEFHREFMSPALFLFEC